MMMFRWKNYITYVVFVATTIVAALPTKTCLSEEADADERTCAPYHTTEIMITASSIRSSSLRLVLLGIMAMVAGVLLLSTLIVRSRRQNQHHRRPKSVDKGATNSILGGIVDKCSTMTTAKNTNRTSVWMIHDVAYDLEAFVKHHPGGISAIRLGQNRPDCTALFESYHPFTDRRILQRILSKYKIDNISSSTISCSSSPCSRRSRGDNSSITHPTSSAKNGSSIAMEREKSIDSDDDDDDDDEDVFATDDSTTTGSDRLDEEGEEDEEEDQGQVTKDKRGGEDVIKDQGQVTKDKRGGEDVIKGTKDVTNNATLSLGKQRAAINDDDEEQDNCDYHSVFYPVDPFYEVLRHRVYNVLLQSQEQRWKDTSWFQKWWNRQEPKQEQSQDQHQHRQKDESLRKEAQRIGKTMMSRKVYRTATTRRVCYYMVLVAFTMISGFAHIKGSIMGSFLFAVFGWLLGCIGHDGGHFAVVNGGSISSSTCSSDNNFIFGSRYNWNDLSLWGIMLLCNPIQWQHQHTYGHHCYTNHIHNDPDLYHFRAFLRVHQYFQHHDMYKYQSNIFFVVSVYTLVVFGTCIWIPIQMLVTGSLYNVVEFVDRGQYLTIVSMIFHWILYMSIIVIWPFYTHTNMLKAIISVVLHLATSGLLFALFSQINHVNEHSFLIDDENDNNIDHNNIDHDNNNIKNNNNVTLETDDRERIPLLKNKKQHSLMMRRKESWAIQQVETSNNFCIDSTFWFYISNGLNLQIEHHLFPCINHCLLHRIQPIVEQTCYEFNVKYKKFDTYLDILHATFDHLKKLAEPSSSFIGENSEQDKGLMAVGDNDDKNPSTER